MNRTLGIAVLSLFAGCSSDSGGSTSALTVPSQMTIIDANGTESSSTLRGKSGAYAIAGSDYETERPEIWVHDDSMEALELVNVILCSIGQTGFYHESVFNQGPYSALVGCEENGEDKSATAGQVEYQDFTVDSSRASADAPHVVKFWFDNERQDDPATRLYGKLTIFESPSADHPFGKFQMSWKELPAAAGPTTEPKSIGSLRTVDRTDNQVEFALFNAQGDVAADLNPGEEAYRMRARVITNAGFTSGQAYTEMRFAYHDGSTTRRDGAEFHLQFNDRYLARKRVGTTTEVKVFDRREFTTYSFDYGLYDQATETRVRDTSGFPVRTVGGDHGYAGYHGLWFPPHVEITQGQELRRQNFRGTVLATYTAFLAPGRLEKQTRTNSTLGNMKNEQFVTFDSVGESDMKVLWNGSDFMKVATFDRSQGTWQTVTPISVASQYEVDQWVHLYNDARGTVQFVWPTEISDTTVVVIWDQSTLNGDATELANGDLTLHGYFNMLKAGITADQANFRNNETPYFPDAASTSESKTYTFRKESLTLQIGEVDVALVDGASLTGGPRKHGLDCGPLVTTPLTSLSEMPAQTTTYVWVTGTEPWQKLTTVKDSNGAFVQFTQPRRFSYTHNEAGNPNHDKTFVLQLEGDELHGIPFQKAPNSDRHYPVLTIPDGTVLTDGAGARFLVKTIRGEQRMVEVDNPSAILTAEGFDLDTTLTPPTSGYVDPAIGARPEISTPPKFVDGKLQQ